MIRHSAVGCFSGRGSESQPLHLGRSHGKRNAVSDFDRQESMHGNKLSRPKQKTSIFENGRLIRVPPP
jgi:hypothetical protein